MGPLLNLWLHLCNLMMWEIKTLIIVLWSLDKKTFINRRQKDSLRIRVSIFSWKISPIFRKASGSFRLWSVALNTAARSGDILDKCFSKFDSKLSALQIQKYFNKTIMHFGLLYNSTYKQATPMCSWLVILK